MDCPSGRRVGLGAVAGPGSPSASGALVQGDLTTQRQRRVITQPAGAADGACGDSLPLWAGVCLGAAPCWQHPAAPAMDLSSHVFPPVTQTLRSAALEDCALCQETLSSSELATKTRDGGLEGAWGAGAGVLRTEQRAGASASTSLLWPAGSMQAALLQLKPSPEAGGV